MNGHRQQPWGRRLACCGALPGAAVLFAAVASVGAGAPPETVRNHHPEQLADTTSVQDPIVSHLRLTGPDAAHPELTAESLLVAFAHQHTAGNYEGAAMLARDLIEMIPTHPEGHYNLACALARLRKTDESIDALNQAVQCGWRRSNHARLDPDLEPLHDDDRFVAALATMDQLAEREQISACPLRTEPAAQIEQELAASIDELLGRYNVPGVIVAYIEEADTAWIRSYGRAGATSDVPMDARCRVMLRQPVELLALVSAGREQLAQRLDLGGLLAQADHIGLRDAHAGSDVRVAAGRRNISRRGTLTGFGESANARAHRASHSSIEWVGSDTIAGTLELIMLGIELTTDTSFQAYCTEAIFKPAGLSETELRFGAERLTSAPGATPQVRCDAETAEAEDLPSTILLLSGHTRFGSAITESAMLETPYLDTTISDLSSLTAALMNANAARTGLGSDPLVAAATSGRLAPQGLGLSINVQRTGDGLRCQFAELRNGRGALARWYPEAGRGVVILFNSENGPEVAARVAQQVLGGQ